MIGIVGSGFGLYGYLPAFAKYTTDKIILLKRYEEKFKNRPELLCYEKRIVWAENESTLLDRADTVVLSMNPLNQADWIQKCLFHKGIKYLCLEKPLAASASSSEALLNKLRDSQKIFRIGYLFQYTDWGKKLLETLRSKTDIKKIEIRWSFMAHHYQHGLNNWKRFHDSGGAVIKFYGIHLIALAALLGYDKCAVSKSYGLSENDLFKWDAVFENKSLQQFDISINSRSENKSFSVKIYPESNVAADPVFQIGRPDPIGNNYNSSPEDLDPRVDYLVQLIGSLFNENENSSSSIFYRNCNKLWHEIEKCNVNTIEHSL